MERDDFSKFSTELRKVCAVFSKEPSPELLQGWWFALRDFPTLEVQGAFDAAIESGEKMPVPADAIAYIEKVRKDCRDRAYDQRAAEDAAKFSSEGRRPFTRSEIVAMLTKMLDSAAIQKHRRNLPPGMVHISDGLAEALSKLPIIESAGRPA